MNATAARALIQAWRQQADHLDDLAADYIDDVAAGRLGESLGLRHAAHDLAVQSGILDDCEGWGDEHDLYYRPNGALACRECTRLDLEAVTT